MQAQSIDFVTRALIQVLPRYLHDYVEDRLREQGIEDTWELAFTERDRADGRRGMTYLLTDPSVQLKLLYFKVAGQPLLRVGPEVSSKAREILKLRNAFAHPKGPIGSTFAMSVLIEVRSLFEIVKIEDAVAELDELIGQLMGLHDVASEPGEIRPDDRRCGGTASDELTVDDVPTAVDVSDVIADERDGTATALDSLRIELETAMPELLVSSTLHQPQHLVRVRLSGTVADLPILRVSLALVAGGSPLTVENDQVVTIASGETVEVVARLVLDRNALMDIDQVVDADLKVTLSASGSKRTLIPLGGRTRVHGPRNWRLASEGMREQTLPGFVQPQQPILSELLKDAAAILQERTGSSALDAYQGEPERTDAIVDAIARAVHARGLTYANPPASWAERTQRIRMAQEVVSDGLATCLDSTVLVASLLEQAGIDGQLWLLPGHIFIGYWKTPDHAYPGELSVSPQLLSNEIDGGGLALLETTALTAAEYPGLGELHEFAYSAAGREGAEHVSQVIDLAGARKNGIFPLPVRAVATDGAVTHVDYKAERRDLRRLVNENLPGSARKVHRDTEVPPRVETWKRELLDLSLRNRLINLTPRAAHTLDVPDEVQGAFEDMLHAGTRFSLDPAVEGTGGRRAYRPDLDPDLVAERLVDDHRVRIDLGEDRYTRDLQKLANTARTVLEETGSNNLYLTMGTLHWTSDSKQLVSPLVLIPVTIVSKARGSRYEIALDETGSSTPNHSLLQRLAHELELSIPGLEDPELDDAGIDLEAAFRSVRDALTRHRLPFRVENRVHLGIFDFGGFRLWKDLDENWREVVKNPLVDHLVHTPADPFEDPVPRQAGRDLDDLVAQLPTMADSSQAQVISEAVSGRTVVVEGPPGTGKSQTITNLIVQAMVEGKRVLFVAEKQAALEVVSRRLRAAGVSDLVLDLHDVSLRPTAVKAKIRSALDLQGSFDEEGLAADRRALDSVRQELVHYRDAVHSKNAAAMSLYSSRTRDLVNGDEVTILDVPAAVIARVSRDQLRHVTTGLGEVAAASRGVNARPAHPWRVLGGPIPDGAEGALLDVLLGIRARIESLPADRRRLVVGLGSPAAADALAALMTNHDVPWELLDVVADPEWERSAVHIDEELDQLRSHPSSVLGVYHPDVVSGPLDDVRAALTEARSAFLGRRGKMRRAFSPLARWELQGQTVPDDHLESAINELLELRDRVVRLSTWVSALPGLPTMPPQALLDPRTDPFVQGELHRLRSARDARAAATDGRLRAELALVPEPERPAFAGVLRDVSGNWNRALDIMQRPWTTDATGKPLEELVEALSGGTDDELTPRGLGLWMALERAVAPLRQIGLDTTATQILDGAVDPVDLPRSFDKGLARASFRERMESGSLRAFDGGSHDRMIDGFDSLSHRVREGSRAAIRSRILAHRDANATPGSNRMASDLRREVSGRARAPKVRPLFTRYGEVISRAMPCVLVSPESASRFIPLGEPMFDIVVFDEASQITVPAAVGAMGRARSVVVVGDSRQMPPTRFAQLTSSLDEEHNDEDSVPDEESILGECVSARVERHWLSHHYRSRTEELIAFSNERYYEGRLSTFPGPGESTPNGGTESPGTRRAGVRMRRVEGTFLRDEVPRKLRRTNPVEADAIVEDVLARFAQTDRAPSIGIVTFNMPQRDHIEARLRELGGDDVLSSLDDPDGLFVKNLENVQGDERDTILFSIAFSPNANGEVPLNFGPLNREGGERRLNVAITRAREEVVVFSSFDPAQLKAERSNSIGLRDLRDYLDLTARGVMALTDPTRVSGTKDRHREDVADALRARGLRVETAIGLSGFRVDLGVGPADGGLVLAIMLDGPSWAERGTAFDRDLLPRSVLTGVAGWQAVERVWLLDWIQRRGEVIDHLGRVVEATVAAALERSDQRLEGSSTGGVSDAPVVDVSGGPGSLEARGRGPVEEDLLSPQPEAGDPAGDFSSHEGAGTDPGAYDESVPAPGYMPTHDLEPQHPTPSERAAGPARVPVPVDVEDPADAGDVDSVLALRPVAERTLTGEGTRTYEVRDPREVSQYVAWRSAYSATVTDLEEASSDPEKAALMTQILESVVATEYPLTSDRAARLAVSSLGLKKVHSSRIATLWGAVDRSRIRIDDDSFVWPTSINAEAFTGYRSGILRAVTIDEIHPQELRNVMVRVLARGRARDPESQFREALAELGGGRLTDNIRGDLLIAFEAASTIPAGAHPQAPSGSDERPTVVKRVTSERAAARTATSGPGRPAIDPDQELAEILRALDEARSRPTGSETRAGLEAVTERLGKRKARLRKKARDGDPVAQEAAYLTMVLRGEVFAELAEVVERLDGREAAGYFVSRAGQDHHLPSMVAMARRVEAFKQWPEGMSTWSVMAETVRQGRGREIE